MVDFLCFPLTLKYEMSTNTVAFLVVIEHFYFKVNGKCYHVAQRISVEHCLPTEISEHTI